MAVGMQGEGQHREARVHQGAAEEPRAPLEALRVRHGLHAQDEGERLLRVPRDSRCVYGASYNDATKLVEKGQTDIKNEAFGTAARLIYTLYLLSGDVRGLSTRQLLQRVLLVVVVVVVVVDRTASCCR